MILIKGNSARMIFKSLRIILVAFILLYSTSVIVFAGAVISEFKGEKGINKVTLKWKARAETSLKGYEVERSLDEVSWMKIGFVKAHEVTGAENSYSYIDRSVFKSATHTFSYRLKILDNDNSFSYSRTVTVTPQISSVRFTWGSIKAMFR